MKVHKKKRVRRESFIETSMNHAIEPSMQSSMDCDLKHVDQEDCGSSSRSSVGNKRNSVGIRALGKEHCGKKPRYELF